MAINKEIEASTGASGALALQLHNHKETDSKSPWAKDKWNMVSVTDYDELGSDVFFAVQPK